MSTVLALRSAADYREVRTRVIAVQPGVSSASVTPDQATVLAGAHGYLLDTVGVPLVLACSP